MLYRLQEKASRVVGFSRVVVERVGFADVGCIKDVEVLEVN